MSKGEHCSNERKTDDLNSTLIHEMFKQTLENQVKQTEATTQLNSNLSDLVTEMKLRDVRDEYQKGEITTLKSEVKKIIEDFTPVIARSRKLQERFDKLWDSAFSKMGLVIVLMVTTGLMYYLGFNPATLKASG